MATTEEGLQQGSKRAMDHRQEPRCVHQMQGLSVHRVALAYLLAILTDAHTHTYIHSSKQRLPAQLNW